MKQGLNQSTDPSVERVEQRVAGAIGHAATTMRLAALAKVQALPAERSLVDLPVLQATEGHPIVLQLNRKGRGLGFG